MSSQISLVWFRKDLRIHDNPALESACDKGLIIPIFIFDPALEEYKNIGGAGLWWLEKSLKSLKEKLSNKLNIIQGNSLDILSKIIEQQRVNNVFWNRCYEPDRIICDKKIKLKLKHYNVNINSFNSSLLWEPWNIKNKQGGVYKVFTPFFKNCISSAEKPRRPNNKLNEIKFFLKDINKDNQFLSYKFKYISQSKHWSNKFNNYWKPGEQNAIDTCDNFLRNEANFYAEGRNFPSKKNVSRLSPHIHWGEVSPFYIWEQANNILKGENKTTFLSEIGWREFSYYLLYHFPTINSDNLKKNYDRFEWLNDETTINSWKLGLTGYPIVDAGMRELWNTGYMHNRVRMISSSFLVKNLLVHWKYGESWFRECLLDADMASNSASWQWVAGTGTDAAPFFRIFNPISQAEKFDGEANYIKKHLPVLAKLPKKYVFQPWTVSKEILIQYDVKLGENYPLPIIDYAFSRKRALDTFKKLTNKNS